MIWPTHGTAKNMLSDDFDHQMNVHIASHCANQSDLISNKEIDELKSHDYQLLSSQYTGWRGYLEGFFGLLLQGQDVPKAYSLRAAKVLGLTFSSDIDFESPSEEALFQDYVYHHYLEKDATWVSRCLKAKPKLLKDDYKAIGYAIQHAYFTFMDILEVMDVSLGVMRVYDNVCKRERIFIDRAFAKTAIKHLGTIMMFSTVIDTGNFLFTTGAGIPIDKTSLGGKVVVNAMERYTKHHLLAKPLSINESYACVTEIVSLCLKGGALRGHTLNYI